MIKAIIIGAGLATLLAAPALAQQTDAHVYHHHVYHHVHHHLYAAPQAAYINANATAQAVPVIVPIVPSLIPHVAPYANGQGDEDGLSTNVDDCNKGCIGGNPN